MTADDIVQEALRLVAVADARDVPLRLLGGIAVAALVPDWQARADRPGRDIDFATDPASRRVVADLLEAEGYTPDRRYNTVNGHRQLYFVDAAHARPVDVLIGRMEMCHAFEFSDHLRTPGPTLPVADLLLSKLQIVRINRKDILDALMLLAEFPLVDGDAPGVDVSIITHYTSSDWGWWRTATGNLETMSTFLKTDLTATDLDVGRPLRFDPGKQVAELHRRLEATPKSLGWKVRARVGDRVPWYQQPEEESHDDGIGAGS